MIQIYLIGISLIALILFGYDKAMAIAHKRRVPERTLLGLGLVGGAWGGLAGMVLFRHKIRRPRFWLILLPSGLFYLWLAVTIGVP